MFIAKVINKYKIMSTDERLEFLPKNLLMIDCEMTGVIPSRIPIRKRMY